MKYSRKPVRCGCYFSLCFLLALLSGCAATPWTDFKKQKDFVGLPPALQLDQVPFNAQSEFQCGPAALATVLQASDIKVTPEELTPEVYIPARRGSLQPEIQAAARNHGRVAYVIAPELEALLRELTHGRPVLVLQNLGLSWLPRWHYSVVIGYDLQKKRVLLNSGTREHYSVSLSVFLNTWSRGKNWGLVVLAPGELPARGTAQSYFLAVAAFARQNPVTAIKAYLAGLNRWRDSKLLTMGLGNSYYENRQLDAAVNAYRKVLAIDSLYAPAHNNLAQTLYELGHTEPALEHARQAVLLGGSHADAYRKTLADIEEATPADAR